MTIDSAGSQTRPITGEELFGMGDIGPCELVRGRIVPKSPAGHPHGRYESNFCFALRSFVEERDLGRVLVGEVGLYTDRRPDTVRGADVLFISHERYAHATERGFLDVAPELVVEIRSPSDRSGAVSEKAPEYLNAGVQCVWIADPSSRAVVVHRSGEEPRTLSADQNLDGEDTLAAFSVPLATLFA